MRIAFFRNVQDYDQLYKKTESFHGIVAECSIIDTIELQEDYYKNFCGNFMRGHDFLSPYIYKTGIRGDIWYGVLVRCKDQQVVVVMNGYQYPRFVGLYNETKDK